MKQNFFLTFWIAINVIMKTPIYFINWFLVDLLFVIFYYYLIFEFSVQCLVRWVVLWKGLDIMWWQTGTEWVNFYVIFQGTFKVPLKCHLKNIWPKLNIHKTLMWRPRRHKSVICTFKLGLVPAEKLTT